MIVYDLNFERITISPSETDAILIVDSNTVLAPPSTLQRFKVITGKDRQISQLVCCVNLHKLSLRHSGDPLKPTRTMPTK
jgi:hypothetical protein